MTARSIAVPAASNAFGQFPRRNMPGPLEAALFAPGAHTYAIIDAARIPGFDAGIMAEGQETACLFAGQAERDLGSSAPHLFALDANSRLTRRLFDPKGLWGARSHVLLRSPHDLATVRAHLRRFTQIADERGKRYFLRFYCPDAMPVILETLADDPARLHRWFFHRGQQVVDGFWIPDADANRMIVHGPGPATAADHSLPFVLDQTYRGIMREIVRRRLLRRVSRAVLLTEENAASLPAREWRAIVEGSIDAAWRAGIGPERAFAHIAMAGLARGRAMQPDEIARAIRLPASPGEQTERAHDLAATLGRGDKDR